MSGGGRIGLEQLAVVPTQPFGNAGSTPIVAYFLLQPVGAPEAK